jgi:hypothetical protein
MWYRFEPGGILGIPRVASYHVAFYDMTRNGSCFDESFFRPSELEEVIPYVETIEDVNNNDRRRVFVNMSDGDVYELKMVKLTEEQLKNRSTFGRG